MLTVQESYCWLLNNSAPARVSLFGVIYPRGHTSSLSWFIVLMSTAFPSHLHSLPSRTISSQSFTNLCETPTFVSLQDRTSRQILILYIRPVSYEISCLMGTNRAPGYLLYPKLASSLALHMTNPSFWLWKLRGSRG